MHALGVVLGTEFKRAVEAGRFRVVCGATRETGWPLDKNFINFGLPKGDINVTPVVRGRGAGGGKGAAIGKIIVGTLLAAATWWMGGPAIFVSLGASIALSGVTNLLSQKKKAVKSGKSYMFDIADNNIDQGGGVPLILGLKVMVPGKPISQGVTVSDTNGFPNQMVGMIDAVTQVARSA